MKVKVETNVDTGVVTYLLYCPGCEMPHMIDSKWSFDANRQRPTFSPSILSEGGPPGTPRCHSFLRNGMWEFLADSEHALAGKTVPMVDLPEWIN